MNSRKYGNVQTEVNGFTFDSRAEAEDWTLLTMRERAGEISRLQRQVSFELQPAFKHGKSTIRPIVHIVDFLYEENGQMVAWDTKGVRTAVWTMKHKMFLYHFPHVKYVVRQVESRSRRKHR